SLVAPWTHRLAARRAAAHPLVRAGCVGGPVHRVGGERADRRSGGGVRLVAGAAVPARRTGAVVLCREGGVAGRPGVFLLALEPRCRRVAAISSSRRRDCRRNRVLAIVASRPRTACGLPHFLRDAIPRARILQHISLPVFLRGGPLC